LLALEALTTLPIFSTINQRKYRKLIVYTSLFAYCGNVDKWCFFGANWCNAVIGAK